MATVKPPIEEGEWVDPAIPLPDHPVRRTLWWAIVNRLPRPGIWWMTVILWIIMAAHYAVTSLPPDLGWFAALGAWTAAAFGFATYEKRLGIS